MATKFVRIIKAYIAHCIKMKNIIRRIRDMRENIIICNYTYLLGTRTSRAGVGGGICVPRIIYRDLRSTSTAVPVARYCELFLIYLIKIGVAR